MCQCFGDYPSSLNGNKFSFEAFGQKFLKKSLISLPPSLSVCVCVRNRIRIVGSLIDRLFGVFGHYKNEYTRIESEQVES